MRGQERWMQSEKGGSVKKHLPPRDYWAVVGEDGRVLKDKYGRPLVYFVRRDAERCSLLLAPGRVRRMRLCEEE